MLSLAVIASAALPLACGGGSAAGRAQGALAANAFSPYLDATLAAPASLAALARGAGLRGATLAFVIARGGACRASWGGNEPLTAVPAAAVGALRAAGAQPRVSFGGAAGPELAQVCPTPAALAAQYRAVIDAYGLTNVDFDVEGAALAPAASDRRWRAIAMLQLAARRAGRPLAVSLTLPVDTTGLPAPALTALRAALARGVQPSSINLLTMDFGTDFPSRGVGMNRYIELAAARTAAQLGNVYPASPPARRWALIGVTPMIGINDVANETFTLGDARALAAWARARGVGSTSMWSLTRDRPCPHGTAAAAQATCSGVQQAPLAFARTFGGQ